jgi:hypothetical protein
MERSDLHVFEWPQQPPDHDRRAWADYAALHWPATVEQARRRNLTEFVVRAVSCDGDYWMFTQYQHDGRDVRKAGFEQVESWNQLRESPVMEELANL